MSTNSLASKGATTADRNMVNPDNRTGFWLHSLQNIEALGIGLVLAATILPLEAGSASATLTNADVLALQSALQQGGVVRLAFDGLMTLSNSFTITTNTTLDATGYAVTLDGGDRVRHFAVTNGITLRLINLALVNGRFVGPDTQINRPGNPGLGGSIYNSGGILELIDCRFSSNQVVGGRGGETALQNVDEPTAGGPGEGAAIYSINGGVTATNCVFASNSCVGGEGAPDAAGGTGRGGDAFGGAIYGSLSQVTLTGVTLSNNFCKGGPAAGFRWRFGGGAAYGGALADGNGNTTVSNCVFSANHALGGSRYVFEAVSGNGGAIFHESGFLLIDRTLLSSNQANGGPGVVNGVDPTIAGDGNGGAIFNGGGRLELRNSALVLNQANGANATCCLNISRGGDGSGGGIYSGATLLLSNCTLAQNLAYGGAALETAFPAPSGSAYGGGIGVGGASLSLANVTVADNSVQVGPGTKGLVGHAIASSIFISSATGSLTNTILACSSSQTNVSGILTDGGHNICSDSSANFTSSSSRMNLDPMLAPLADNGWATPTMALLPNSPAIDAGDDSVCPPTDQRGVARPQGLVCDIGAFELAPKITLTKPAGGAVTLDYAFEAGKTNIISTSTNLINWVLFGTKVSDTNGVFQINDSEATNLPQRFYQIRLQ